MPQLPTSIPAWAANYIGIPFLDRGRDRRGADCWGLVRLVYAERLGIILPALTYSSLDQISETAADLVQERDESRRWQRLAMDETRIGDVHLFRASAVSPPHVGVAIARGSMLHTRKGSESCIERIDVPTLRSRHDGVYRFVGPVRLRAASTPLHSPSVDVELPVGLSVAEMLGVAGIAESPLLRVFVGDRELPRAGWTHVRPKAGRRVSVTMVPAGGGGGKTPLRLILSVAVVAAAVALPGLAPVGWGLLTAAGGLTFAGALVSAGVSLVGTLAINALIPAPRPRLSENSSSGTSLAISGARNEARPYGVVPRIFGEHRVAPLYGSLPYTELVGDDQYLRLLFVVGYGPLEMSDLRIGETALSEYEGVEVEIREGRDTDGPLALFPSTVTENAESTLLEQGAGWTTRTSDTLADELSIDITFPQGLVEYTADGGKLLRTVAIEVEYSPTGLNTWTAVNGASPDFGRGLDFMFRGPEVTLGGSGIHTGEVAWGLGFANAKPAYLPASFFSWEAEGYVFVDGSAYIGNPVEFGVDCSDAGEISIGGRVVASWYGSHSTAGAATPDYAAHSGSISLKRGWHKIRLRVESRSTSGAAALGWKRSGDAGFSTIPASALARTASGGNPGTLAYRWFDTSVYRNTLVVQADRPEQMRKSVAWAVPSGQYDVRIRRTTPDTDSDRIADKAFWTALRTIRTTDPVKLPGLARIALRIKATDQLNGVLDNFNLLARSILPDWDAATSRWVERATRNPASCYRAALQEGGNARPLADGRLDLPEIQAFHEECTANGFSCDLVIDFAGTLFERLNDIAATGRGSFGMRDGRYSVVRDKPQTVPVQHFTPRNSHSFRGSRAFNDLPHALRVGFINRENGYSRDERLVLDDGFQIDGKDAFDRDAPDLPPATRFETLELLGVTDPATVWRHARYFIAVGRLRPETIELSTDIEHLACTRGDLVLVTHDVPQWGLNFGRVVRVMLDTDGNLVGLTLDETVTMAAGETYVVRIRLEDGTSWVKPIITEEGEHTELMLGSVAGPGDAHPKPGDLVMFGRLGAESREFIVKAIEIDKDLGATLTLLDHAPAVHAADQGEIPPYEPGISQPPNWARGPETPVIESIRSDDFVMIRDSDGSLRARMLIALRRPSGTRPLANAAQVRLRPVPPEPAVPTGPWSYRPLLPLDANQLSITDVEEGQTYDIKLRTVTATGLTSAWIEARHTIVGKTAPPPDVASFDVTRLADGTRRYAWDIGLTPPDIAGVVIRFGPVDSAWDAMTPVHEGILQSSPDEANQPPAGTWRFGIRAIDTSGNLSVNPLYIVRTLGETRIEGVAFSSDAGTEGWPGTKTGCITNAEGYLESVDRATWDTLPAFGAPTWDAWTRWIAAPTNPISYESLPLDTGFVLEATPDAIAAGFGDIVVELAWSLDNVTYTAWEPVATARLRSEPMRYLKARVTCTINNVAPVPTITRLLLLLRAAAAFHEIQDLDTSTLGGLYRFGPGDVRLPVPAAKFSTVRFIDLSFNGMGAGWSFEVVDKDATTGPRVRIYNAQDQPADALIDAVIRGL
jgi:hypothetical protein